MLAGALTHAPVDPSISACRFRPVLIALIAHDVGAIIPELAVAQVEVLPRSPGRRALGEVSGVPHQRLVGAHAVLAYSREVATAPTYCSIAASY